MNRLDGYQMECWVANSKAHKMAYYLLPFVLNGQSDPKKVAKKYHDLWGEFYKMALLKVHSLYSGWEELYNQADHTPIMKDNYC